MKYQDPGVLYIRYDKNTFCGQIIEKRKAKSSRKLNGEILKLIFLSEVVEPLNFLNVDLRVLNDAYYQSLRLFTDKLNQTHHKLNKLNKEILEQKIEEPARSSSAKSDSINEIAFLPVNKICQESRRK